MTDSATRAARRHQQVTDEGDAGPAVAGGGPPRWLLAAVVALSAGAGAVHLAVANHHFEEWWVSGVFFVVVATAQLVFAGLLLLPATRPVLAVLGIVGNLAVVATYVLSRTIGVPVGWHAWTPEKVGVVDFGTTGAEVALIVCLLPYVPRRLRPWIVNGLCACGLLAWGLRLTGVL